MRSARLAIVNTPADDFSSATTEPILKTACRSVGLDPSGARLLRHHTNAVYHLPRPGAIAKITRPGAGLPRVRLAVGLAEYLTECGVPAVTPYSGITQPITVDGHHVTFWTAIEPVRYPGAADLAFPLRRLHDSGIPRDLDLPHLDPFAAISRSLARAGILDDKDRGFLADRATALAKNYEGLEYASVACVIHGDAHHSNALVGASGPVLADLESACIGHPEWDLATLAVHCERFRHPREEFVDFAGKYGRDVREWPGFTTLKEVRELRMITTNSWKAKVGSPAASEVRRRIKALRRGFLDQPWNLL